MVCGEKGKKEGRVQGGRGFMGNPCLPHDCPDRPAKLAISHLQH